MIDRDEASTLVMDVFNRMNLEVPSVDTDLFDEGVLDSLTFVQLLTHLERTFGVTFSLQDLEIDHFRSMRCIADFVVSRHRARPSPTHAGSVAGRAVMPT
jgi:acyl carrier protein